MKTGTQNTIWKNRNPGLTTTGGARDGTGGQAGKMGHDQRPALAARVAALMAHEVAFVDHPYFRNPRAKHTILSDRDELPSGEVAVAAEGSPLSPYGKELQRSRILTAIEEARLFRRMNYCKFAVCRLKARLDVRQPSVQILEEIESLLKQAQADRAAIVTANLRLVVSIARHFAGGGAELDDLVSDGNIALLGAVEKFDFGRGFRFSTYATHAIRRELVRKVRRYHRDRARFSSGCEIVAEAAGEWPLEEGHTEPVAVQFGGMAALMEQCLTERERLVLSRRFGLGENEGAETLATIAEHLMVSKERVRQLERKALETLRARADRRPAF